MKHIIILIFLLSFLSCTGRQNSHCIEDNNSSHESQTSDSRCDQIMAKAHQEAQASGYCYSGPLLKGFHKEAIDPDKEKCDAIYKAGGDKCRALPYDPKYITTLSGTSTYKGGKKVSQDGQPICD